VLDFPSISGTYTIVKNVLGAFKQLTTMQLAEALQQAPDVEPVSEPQQEGSSSKQKRCLGMLTPRIPVTSSSPGFRDVSPNLPACMDMLTTHPMKKKMESRDDGHDHKETNTETKGSKAKLHKIPNKKKGKD
jgi:hypothetical protein